MVVDKIFEALASAPRRKILAYLSTQKLPAGDIAARLKMSGPSISRHLMVLENAGLIRSERQGQYIVYELTPDNLVNTLSQFAFEICPIGGPLKRESRKNMRSASLPDTNKPLTTARKLK